jgi:hypothetical protein
MIYYKELDLPCADIVQEKTLRYVKEHTKILTEEQSYNWRPLNFEEFTKHVPELFDAVTPLGLVPDMVALFVVHGPDKTGMHADAYHQRARINFPILNCNGSSTSFYSNAKLVKVTNTNNSISNFKVVNTEECIRVATVEIKKPVLLRIDEPHKVEIPVGNALPRITLTVGFTVDPISLLE